MSVIPFVHEGLGNSSYLVPVGDREAALIDPDRTVGRYLAAAAALDREVTHVFETHLHADFVSGALDLHRATGAAIHVPAAAAVRFPHRPVAHQQAIELAPGVAMTAIASPGHTPEHMSYVLEAGGLQAALFSGGSLLVGSAARTDLVDPALTESLTRAQFRTIHEAFAQLPDETSLMPTHGGGSFCSVGSGGDRTSTLGLERRANAVLLEPDEDAFTRWFPAGFPAVPAYFARMRPINQAGPRPRSDIRPPLPLAPADFEAARGRALVIDTRPQAEFMRGHIPGSLNIAFRDAFATWLGWLVTPDQPLLFITGDEPLEALLDECLLVGYESFAGTLAGGLDAWARDGRPLASAPLTDAHGARGLLADGAVAVDVREPDEFLAGHIPGALHIPLGRLAELATTLPRDRPLLTYCGHGERSATALSLLEGLGFSQITNLDGGMEAWEAARYSATSGGSSRP